MPKVGTSISASRLRQIPPASPVEGNVFASSVNGTDGGAGTFGDPVDSLDEVVGLLSSGDLVRIERGASFRSQHKSAVEVAIRPYGDGAMPVVDGTEEVTGWTQNGSYSNVWQTDITANQDSSSGGEYQAFKNGTRLSRASSVQDVSNNGGWYADNFDPSSTTATTIYVQASSDPDTSGNVFEVSVDDHALELLSGSAQSVIEGPMELTRHFGHYGSVAVRESDGVVVKNLLLVDGTSHHIVTSGSRTEHVVALGGNPAHGVESIAITAYQPDPTGKDHVFDRCWALGTDGTREARHEAVYAHGSGNYWNRIDFLDLLSYKRGMVSAGAVGGKYVKGGYFREVAGSGMRDITEEVKHVTHRTETDDGATGAEVMMQGAGSGVIVHHCYDLGGGIEQGGWDGEYNAFVSGTRPANVVKPATLKRTIINTDASILRLNSTNVTSANNLFLGNSVEYDWDGARKTGLSTYQSDTGDTSTVLEANVTGNLDQPPAAYIGDEKSGDFRLDPDLPIFDEANHEFGNIGPQSHRRLDGTVVDGPRCHWPHVEQSLPLTRSDLRQHLEAVDEKGHSSFTRPSLTAGPTDVQVRVYDGETLVLWRPPDTQTYTEQVVERSDDGGSTWNKIASFTGPKTRYYYRDTGVSNGNEYQYRIKVTDN
jgi:hypothetical protein